MQNQYISDLKNTLIPNRYRNVSLNFAPHDLAENILKGDAVYSPKLFSFYELFVDILFLDVNSENDRRGLSSVFDGLSEILNAASDYANLPIDFREELQSALENFQSSLKNFKISRGAGNDFLAVPEKQHNAITFLLSKSRKDFLLTDFFPPELNRKRKSATFFYETVENLCNFLTEEKSLINSEPLARELTYSFKIDSEKQPQSALSNKTVEIYHYLKDKIEKRWCKLCLVGYRAARIALETDSPKEDEDFNRRQKTTRAIEIALEYIPAEAIEKDDVIVRLPSGAISDAMRLCYFSGKYCSSTVDGVSRIAWFLLQGTQYIWKTRWRRRYSNRPTTLIQDLDEDGSRSRKKTLAATEILPAERLENEAAWMDEIAFEIEEGGAPDELFDVNSPTKEDSPDGTSSESQPFRLLFDHAPWGRGNLTEETIGVVWSWLITQAQAKPQNLLIQHLLLFVELLIHHGFQTGNLLKAKYTLNSFPDSEKEAIQIAPKSLYLAPKRGTQASAFGAPLPAESQDYYLPSQTGFEIPLPQRLIDLINDIEKLSIKSSGSLYFTESKKNQSPKTIKKNFNELLKPIGEILGDKITIEKIARSIRALLREQGKLTELETAILSTEVPHRIISPSFYTNVSIKDLVSRFREAITVNTESIVNTSWDYVRHLKLPELSINDKQAECSNCEKGKNEQEISLIENLNLCAHTDDSVSKSNDLRLGSPFVPRSDKYGAYLNNLKSLSRNSRDFVLNHNRRTAVAVLSLMTLTGLRPLEISSIEKRHFTQSGNKHSLTVLAKLNQKHTEWRQLPLSSIAAKILRDHIQFSAVSVNNPQLTSRIFQPVIRERIGQSVFYYFRKNYIPIALTTQSLYQLLKNNSYLEYELFPWKLNSPRHLYRTIANDMRVPEKIINRLMGHQTTGLEAIGQFSADDYNHAAQYVQKISEKICEALNYEA